MKSLLSSVVLLAATVTLASPVYPDAVQAKLSLTDIPDCSLCHLNNITGAGTVNTPFGKALRMAGAVGGSQTSKIDMALATLETNNTDSDADGMGDIAELKAGRDPNVKNAVVVTDGGTDGGVDGGTGGGTAAGGGSATGGSGGGGGAEVIPPPKFGCGASTMPGLMSILAGAVFLARRRR